MAAQQPELALLRSRVRILPMAVKRKSLDLTWLTSPNEIPACHSSRGGEFGERIDSVKDAS
jgi:hypothetical protein